MPSPASQAPSFTFTPAQAVRDALCLEERDRYAAMRLMLLASGDREEAYRNEGLKFYKQAALWRYLGTQLAEKEGIEL